MVHQTQKIIFLAISSIFFFISLIFVYYLDQLRICFDNGCMRADSLIGAPLLLLSIIVFVSVVILYPLSQKIFKIWRNFTLLFIPFVAVFIAMFGDSSSGWAVPSLTAPEDLAIIFSVIYAIVTMAIILRGLIKRGASTESNKLS